MNDLGNELASFPRDILIYRLSLLLVILHFSDSWVIFLPVSIASLFVFTLRSSAVNRWLWLCVLLGITVYNFHFWNQVDNHKYLINYWVGACFLSTFYKDRLNVLKANANVLIILTFLFALYWKIASPDFLNGTFMQLQLLTEPRLQYLTVFFTNIEYDLLKDKLRLMEFMVSDPNLYMKITLNSDPVLMPLALLLTYSALVLEFGILASFILTKIRFFRMNRDYFLLVFLAATYLFVPVVAFGFTLAILGIAQIELYEIKKFKLYFLAFIFLQIMSRFSVIDLIRGDFSF